MFSLIKGAMCKVQCAMGAFGTRHLALFLVLLATVVMSSCAPKSKVTESQFFNFDSLVNKQVAGFGQRKYELNKLVEINGKKEEIRFTPDSTQWSNELEIFRLLDALNKASFRDGYVVSEMRDTNSNLTVREIKALRPAPVSLVKFFYLRTPNDLRRIEATWLEDNTLYTNTRRMVMELDQVDNQNLIHRYRIEGFQKMVMDDSVKFLVAGEVTM